MLDEEEGKPFALREHGDSAPPKLEVGRSEHYPWSYTDRAEEVGKRLADLVQLYHPTDIVVEETNGSRHRYAQKLLEWCHYCLMRQLEMRGIPQGGTRICYVSTSTWRSKTGATLKTCRKEKIDFAWVKGVPNSKHASVARANQIFPALWLRAGDHNKAEAILLGLALLRGARSTEPTTGSTHE